MGLSRPPLAGHVLFSLLPGNGYDKVLEESAVGKTGRSNKSLATTVLAKVAFSKEREAGDSWWVSDGAGCVPIITLSCIFTAVMVEFFYCHVFYFGEFVSDEWNVAGVTGLAAEGDGRHVRGVGLQKHLA